MPPAIASLLCWMGIAAFVRVDRDDRTPTSPAVWLAVVWVAIGASRMLSEWTIGAEQITTADQYVEGSPFDMLFLSALLLTALYVLAYRRERLAPLLQGNLPIILFLLYCALTAVWSDFPMVTIKRWTKLLGNVVMMLVVLTDVHPHAALKRLFARVAFLLVPTSILLIKYYPQLGRGYDRWEGTAMYTGVTDNKNSLGSLCLVCALGMLWLVLEELKEKPRRMKPLCLYAAVLAMTLWLFYMANSATSLACFLVGASLMIALTRPQRGRPRAVHFIIGSAVFVAVVGLGVLGASGHVLEALGRDATLTGRTELWETLLKINKSPLLGEGFESFFLGDRADYLWAKYWWHPNEAHNGYLELYLTLGTVGLTVTGIMMASGYRHIINVYRQSSGAGTIRIAFWTVAILYNCTEAGIKVMHPVWIALLMAVVAPLPLVAAGSPTSAAAPEGPQPAPPKPAPAFSVKGARRHQWPTPEWQSPRDRSRRGHTGPESRTAPQWKSRS